MRQLHKECHFSLLKEENFEHPCKDQENGFPGERVLYYLLFFSFLCIFSLLLCKRCLSIHHFDVHRCPAGPATSKESHMYDQSFLCIWRSGEAHE